MIISFTIYIKLLHTNNPKQGTFHFGDFCIRETMAEWLKVDNKTVNKVRSI